MSEAGELLIVCSERSRNGKTLLARLLAEWHALRGHALHVVDLDHPETPLAARFDAIGSVTRADFSSTQGRVRVFDTIMGDPRACHVVDVPARHFSAFIDDVERLDFLREATVSGLNAAVYFIVDAGPRSLRIAADLHARCLRSEAAFIPVRGGCVPDPLSDEAATERYLALMEAGEIVLPRLSDAAVGFVESPSFSFSAFLSGRLAPPSSLVDFELQDAVNGIFEQFDRLRLRLDIDGLKNMGLI